jgi:hypothetical protein
MKKITPPTAGKIMDRGKGAGVFSPDDVENRARAIARTEGRADVREDDRRRATDELQGRALPPTADTDAECSLGMTRDPSEPLSDYGTQKPNIEAPDEQKAAERLVSEGVEEAQEDQMIAAQRRRRT